MKVDVSSTATVFLLTERGLPGLIAPRLVSGKAVLQQPKKPAQSVHTEVVATVKPGGFFFPTHIRL